MPSQEDQAHGQTRFSPSALTSHRSPASGTFPWAFQEWLFPLVGSSAISAFSLSRVALLPWILVTTFVLSVWKGLMALDNGLNEKYRALFANAGYSLRFQVAAAFALSLLPQLFLIWRALFAADSLSALQRGAAVCFGLICIFVAVLLRRYIQSRIRHVGPASHVVLALSLLAVFFILHKQGGTLVSIRPGTESIHVGLFCGTAFGTSIAMFVLPLFPTQSWSRGLRALLLLNGLLALYLDSHLFSGLYPWVHVWLFVIGSCAIYGAVPFVEEYAQSRPTGSGRLLNWAAYAALCLGLAGALAISTQLSTRVLLVDSVPGRALLAVLPPFQSLSATGESVEPLKQDLSSFEDQKGRFNLVLITADALRNDYLDRDRMPETFAFAERGIRFSHAYAQGPKTAIGLSSLLTGRYSAEMDWDLYFGSDSLTKLTPETFASAKDVQNFAALPHIGPGEMLAEGLLTAGYSTFATLDSCEHAYFSEQGLFARGFQNVQSLGTTIETQDASQQTTDAAIAQRRSFSSEGKRFFQWVHYFDPHRTLVPDKYADSVKKTDRAVGALLQSLVRDGLWENTVVVFTADHGRALGEHGMFGHATNLYDEQVRVPLWMHVPGYAPSSVKENVASIDVTRTLQFLGAAPISSSGQSIVLLPLALGQPAPPRMVCTELHTYGAGGKLVADYKAGVVGPLKVHLDRKNAVSSLYNLEEDPREMNPVRSPRAGQLTSEINAFFLKVEASSRQPEEIPGQN